VIVLAAGGGVQSALSLAARTGDGWAYGELRRALESARISRTSPWDALGRLGAELGVGELSELAASMQLAGTEGARVRDSLVAKARSIRTHELAESEAEAGVATERMSFPVALLAFGFFALIGYPAVAAVLHGI
jgi:Flp pilus assembly protein TadB